MLIDPFAEDKNLLPLYNVHFIKGAVRSEQIVTSPFWQTTDAVDHFPIIHGISSGGAVAYQERCALPGHPLYGYSTSPNAAIQHLVNITGPSMLDAGPTIKSGDTGPHHFTPKSELQKSANGTGQNLSVPHPKIYTRQFRPIAKLRSGQGGKTLTSLRLPAKAQVRNRGPMDGVRRPTSLRYAPKSCGAPNDTLPSSNSTSSFSSSQIQKLRFE